MKAQFDESNFTEMCSGSDAGLYLKLIDCVYLLNSSLECNKEEEEARGLRSFTGPRITVSELPLVRGRKPTAGERSQAQ